MYSGSKGRMAGWAGETRPENMYFAAERLAYFSVDSCNKTGQNGFSVKPSQDREEKIFEK